MIVLVNRKKTELNVNSVEKINLKIELESFALNLVGKMNVTRQVSETFKTKSNLEYRIDNYENNYVIYVPPVLPCRCFLPVALSSKKER